MPGEPTPVEVAVGRFKARYDKKAQLQGEVETLRKATVELKRKVDDHVALEAQEQVDAEEEEWEEIEVEEGELLDGIDTDALSERELTSLQAAVPKYPVLAEEIADLEQQLRHTRRLKEVLVKALKEHGSKGRLKLPGKALLQPGKAKPGAKQQGGLLPPPKESVPPAPKQGLLPPPSIKPPGSVSRESSTSSQGEGLLRRPSNGEGLLKPPTTSGRDTADAMDVDAHEEEVEAPSGKRKEAPPGPAGKEAAPPSVVQGEAKATKKARADSPRPDDGVEEDESRGGDSDELEKEITEIWDRIKHEPFKEAKAFQIMFNRYVLIDKLQRATPEELESNVERMVRLLVRCNKHERRRIASHHACTRIIATYKRRMMHLTDEQRIDKAEELLNVPTSMNTETGTMLAVVVTLILRLCSEELYTGLFLDLVLDRLCPQVYRLRTTLDLLLSPDGPTAAPPFAHEESAPGDEDEARWEVGSTATTTSTTSTSVSLYQWGLKEARASHAVTLLFTVLCRKAREPDRVRSLLHDLLAMAGGGMGAVAPVSAILRTWPSVLKSRYSYMGRLVPRLLADGIHRASAALSEQAALHEEEEEDKDKDRDDKGKGKDGRDKGREKDRDRDDNKRRRVEAKRPEARYFQRACEDVYRSMCRALECPIPPSLAEDRGDKEVEKEEGVEGLVPELLKGIMEGEEEGQISEAIRAIELVAAAQPITWLDETLQKHGYSDAIEPVEDEEEEEEKEEDKQRRRVAERVMRLRAGLARELTSRAAIAAGGALLPTQGAAQGLGEDHTDISAHVQFIRDLTRRFLQGASVAFRPILSCTSLPALASNKPLTSLPITYVHEEDQGDDVALVKGRRGEALCMGYWALMGLACMPGQELGNLKEAMEPLRRLRERERNVIPDLVLRAVLNSQRRPHCVVLTNREGGQVVGGVRESEAQEWMVQQAVFHDLSFKMVNPQTLPLLLKSEQKWDVEWGRQKGALDRDHVALWYLYSTKRLTALDYTTDCPPELVVLEGGVVGHPNLGPDLRNLMQELRHRDKDWDMLTLAFALPPKREWHRDGDDGRRGHVTRGEFAEVAPKGTYISSSAYILSMAGACKLLRHWYRFESVEACFNSLVTAPHFSVLIPGEAAEVFHVDHDHPLVLQAIRGGSIDEA